jgi:hypothetical protein
LVFYDGFTYKVTEIDNYAFADITTITNHIYFCEGLEKIGKASFAGLSNIKLNELIIPSTIKLIDTIAFNNVSFTKCMIYATHKMNFGEQPFG